MKLFPFRVPTIGLSIDAQTLGLAEIARDWRPRMAWPWLRWRLRCCAERPLPAGLVRPSATEPNVSDVSALARELGALFEHQRNMARPVSVALSLPDLCARVALFEFEKLPAKPAELESLVRWRVQQEMNMPAGDVRLAYRVFRAPQPRLLPSGEKVGMREENNGEGAIRVLAVAVRRAVIEPYEQACEAAGCIPVSVGMTSLRLFDLFRPAMRAAHGDARECFFLHIGESSFAFFAMRSGTPVFLRVKPLRNGLSNGNGAAQPTTTPPPTVVVDELLATVQFYRDRYGSPPREAAASMCPLFVINEQGDVPTLPESLGVAVTPIGWENVPMPRPSASTPVPFASLPAFAGVMEA